MELVHQYGDDAERSTDEDAEELFEVVLTHAVTMSVVVAFPVMMIVIAVVHGRNLPKEPE